MTHDNFPRQSSNARAGAAAMLSVLGLVPLGIGVAVEFEGAARPHLGTVGAHRPLFDLGPIAHVDHRREVGLPDAVHVVDAPAARSTVQISPTTSSDATTPVRSTLPSLVTTYSHVTASPARISGPGAASASNPFVDFSIDTDGAAPK